MKNLEDLSIDFGWCETVTGNGVSKIFEIILMNTKIKTLNLEISGCSQMQMIKFVQNKGNCENLEQLSLDVSYNEIINDEAFTALAHAISSSANSLKIIHLDLNKCPQVTDKGFSNLSESLNSTKFLKEFQIQLSENPNITDIGLECFILSISGLVSLEVVKLDFSGIQNLTDSTLVCMKEEMIRLGHLQTFRLNLSRCNEITSLGIFQLGNLISNLKALKKINLSFPKSLQSIESELHYLSEVISYRCPFINESSIQFEEEELDLFEFS